MKPPEVSIIVPTIDTPALTRACLESVLANTRVPYELIVSANTRSRRTRRMLRSFREVRVLWNGKNLGFTRAVNRAARVARGSYLCFLNSDTLVPPGWLERLLEAVRRPNVGAAGPVTSAQWFGRRGPPRGLPMRKEIVALLDQAAQRRFRGNLQSVSLLTGCCWILPRGVMERLGPFDERYFFGWEDLDYCVRLRLLGYKLLKVHSLFIHHVGGGSTSSLRRRKLVKKTERQFLGKWGPCFGKDFRKGKHVFGELPVHGL